ncbi:histidine kinase OS=Streptomyces antimycoticus OX=68175 GN=afsQ2 PE=4 SV=1 [Streptomyces antimycoticus]
MENAHIHGGDISAANSPEGGAVFTLRLPMDASRIASDEAEDDLGDLDREGAAEGERDDGGRTWGKGKGRIWGKGKGGNSARATGRNEEGRP